MRKEINYMRMAVMNTVGAEQEVCISILRKLERKYKTKRNLNKIRIALLKAITYLAVFLFIFGACLADSANIAIPVILMVVSGLWLALMGVANSEITLKA